MTQDINSLSKEELIALLSKQSQKGSNIKVSQKGAVSVYGLGRFPVTLYKSQWERLIDMAEAISTFIQVNSDRLASKQPA